MQLVHPPAGPHPGASASRTRTSVASPEGAAERPERPLLGLGLYGQGDHHAQVVAQCHDRKQHPGDGDADQVGAHGHVGVQVLAKEATGQRVGPARA